MSMMEDTQSSEREKNYSPERPRICLFFPAPLPIYVMRQEDLDTNSVFTHANDS